MAVFKKAFANIFKDPKLLVYPVVYAFLNYYVMRKLTPSLEGSASNPFAVNNMVLIISILIISYLYRVAYISMVLRYLRNNKIALDIYRYLNIKTSAKLVLLDIMVAVVAIAASLLLIIPGVFWIVSVILYSIILVDHKDLSLTEILKNSLKYSKGYKWVILLVVVIISVSNLFSMSLPYVMASLLDGFITAYTVLIFSMIYLDSSKKVLKAHSNKVESED